MRRFFLVSAAVILVVVAIGVVAGVSVHWADLADGMTLSIDGETFEGPAVAAMLGGIVASGAAIACLTFVAVVASVAIVVPVVLLLLAVVALGAFVVGLSPILVPVLLVVGAYGLLSRARGRARSLPASTGATAPNAAPSSASSIGNPASSHSPSTYS